MKKFPIKNFIKKFWLKEISIYWNMKKINYKKFLENHLLMKSHERMDLKSLSAVSYGKADTRFNVGQMKSFINGEEYWIHPIYDLYGANKKGEVINIHRGLPRKGNYKSGGYMRIIVRVSGVRKEKKFLTHRFIYECFNGIIPEGLVIDHINNIRDDNRLCNLQLLTPQQNSKKPAVNRDYSFRVL